MSVAAHRLSTAAPGLGRLLGRPDLSEPTLVRLDARERQLDEPQLRAWARALCDSVQARYASASFSRSYAFPYALVAWHDGALGVDVEQVTPCPQGFAHTILTPQEQRTQDVSELSDTDLTSIWSSKEALAKALGDARRYEPTQLDSPCAWPGGRAGPWRARPLALPLGLVGWLCWSAQHRADEPSAS